MEKAKVLLVYPHSAMRVFEKTKVAVAVSEMPSLSLATLASNLLKFNHDVRILDLGISKFPMKGLVKELKDFSPDYVGITFSTPLFYQMVEIVEKVKKYDKGIITIGGGPHSSSLPKQTLKDSRLDMTVVGEGEETLLEIVSGKPPRSIRGLCFKKNKKILLNPRRELIKNLDDLPLPAWDLFDIKKYKTSKLTSRKNPVGPIETSRGCPFGCVFCSKSVFGRTWRMKSVNRVVNEIEYMLECGFKEIHVMDDGFSNDMKRAKNICDEIVRRGLDFPWSLINGIRVDRIDRKLFDKMKRAGCYLASFGVESGCQNILDKIQKGTDLAKIKKAFKLANDVGIETLAFFMIGLPNDTEETIKKSIDFAKELEPDIVKVSITMPFPGTRLFLEWDSLGLIKTKNWSKYYYHTPNAVYKHPNMSWETIYKYYNTFYREVYLNPRFISRRILKDLKNGRIFLDLLYFLKTLRYGW